MIPWMAFVDISGVCSVVGTREINSIPRNTDSTNTTIIM